MVRFVDESANPFPDDKTNKLVAKNQAGVDKAREIHLSSDIDFAPDAQHHSLGSGPTQAAPGNHVHPNYIGGGPHTHLPTDIQPPIDVPDEIIVADVAPVGIAEGTIWVDSSKPDADTEGIYGTWGTDPKTITSTTYTHPTNWATPAYVPPISGFVVVNASVQINSSALIGPYLALFRLAVLDNANAIIQSHVVESNHILAAYTAHNFVSAPVVESVTHKIVLQFALSNVSGVQFIVSRPVFHLTFFPSTQWTTSAFTTVP